MASRKLTSSPTIKELWPGRFEANGSSVLLFLFQFSLVLLLLTSSNGAIFRLPLAFLDIFPIRRGKETNWSMCLNLLSWVVEFSITMSLASIEFESLLILAKSIENR